MNPITHHSVNLKVTGILIMVLALALSACGGAPAATSTDEAILATEAPATATPEPSPTLEPPTSTPEPAPTATTPPSPTPEISGEMQATMDEIDAQVSAVRGLTMTEAVTVDVQSLEEVEQTVVDRLTAEYTEDEQFQDLVTYSFLGLIPPDFDIRGFFQALYTEDVRTSYDPPSDTLALLQGIEFDPMGKMSYVTSSTHALLDGAYDLDGDYGLNDENCSLQAERCRGLQALVGGDVSLVNSLWMQSNTTPEEQSEIAAASQMAPPVLSSAPAFYQEDTMFPYTVGVQFANALYQQGGWEAIDAAYANPPASTEQIIHPERYPLDVPLEVSLPDLLPVLGEGWILLDQDTLGEWYTLLLLTSGVDPAARLSIDVALPAATGWAGDLYQVYYHPESQLVVLVLKTQWENADETQEFLDALTEHMLARFSLEEAETELIAMFQAMQLGHAQLAWKDTATYYFLTPAAEITEAVMTAVLE